MASEPKTGSNATGLNSEILLNAGTNELEVLVFRLGEGWYGINVAKVREVILPPTATRSPESPEGIVGMFNIRGSLVPMVDLSGHLGVRERLTLESVESFDGRVIICEFNNMQVGFLVDAVDQIRRMSWSTVRPAPEVGDENVGVITGVIDLEDRLVLMLDFESIADEVSVEEKLHVESVPNELGVDRESQRVILAEDSKFMRDRLRAVLTASGYVGVEIYGDGEAAWRAINGPHPDGVEPEPIAAIVSDIEMPGMDGLHLCKLVKDNPIYRDVPVLLFSSLISKDNLKKGKQVGADHQVAKPELADVVTMIDRLIKGLPIEDTLGGDAIPAKAA
jgi:two-component system chemotaxis response regulator CheV